MASRNIGLLTAKSAMGSGGSKPEQHIFNPDAPVTLSQSVIKSLQSSPETDSTRARSEELKIQDRVNAELKRIRDDQGKRLESLTASLTTNPPKEDDTKSPDSLPNLNSLAYHLSSPFYQDSSEKKESLTGADSGRSHDSVEKEVMDLRQKLDARKKVEKIPADVEKAKESLVQCLRTNDRRPLDCWQEVETFKKEVGKLEKAFIQKAGQ